MTHKNIVASLIFSISLLLSNLCYSALPEKNKSTFFILTNQQWSVPRDAMSVLSMPAIQNVMKYLSNNNEYSLVIRYPGGEVGTLWASDVKGWLVSLGLSSSLINLQAGGLKTDVLEFRVIKKTKK